MQIQRRRSAVLGSNPESKKKKPLDHLRNWEIILSCIQSSILTPKTIKTRFKASNDPYTAFHNLPSYHQLKHWLANKRFCSATERSEDHSEVGKPGNATAVSGREKRWPSLCICASTRATINQSLVPVSSCVYKTGFRR